MKLRYYLAASVATLVIAPAITAPVFAQQITSQIEGQVTDGSGQPVSGATVVITDTRTASERTLTVGNDGRFTAPNLTTGGPYTITATAAGFQGQTVENVNTTLQGATSLTFELASETGAEEDVIVVTGSRVSLAEVAVGPGQSFGAEVLENAPSFNRDVRDIIRIDPRVSLDRDDGGSGQDRISCLGGNDRGNAFTVDGISQGDIYGLNDTGFSSRSSTPIPYDAVRETQVQFAPFDVEYGNFTGCAINVVTKSGGNRFSGGAFFEYSNNDLRGDSIDGGPVAPIQSEKNYGVSLGGPIIPDRLFFFGAYEHQEAGQAQDDGPAGAGFPNELAGVPVAEFDRISEILSRVYGVETGPLVTSRPFENDRYFGRLDWNITDDHRLELTYQRLEEASVRSDDFFNSQSSPQVTGENTFYLSGTKSNYYSGRLYSQWTDNFATELRYSRSEITDRQDPIGGGEAQSDNPIPRIIVGVDNASGPDGTVLAGPGISRSANDLRTTLEQYRAVARLDAGNHQIKLGFELNRADIFNLFVQNATGTLVFRNAADLEAGLLSPGLGNNQTSTFPNNVIGGQTEGAFGNFTASGDITDAAAEFKRSIYSVYAQDDWQVNDRLELVLGVRADIFDGGRPDLNPLFLQRYGFPNTSGFSTLDPIVMPRLGFTYELDDFSVVSNTQIRGGVGIFSGGDPLVWFGNAFQNNGFGFSEGSLQSAGCPAQNATTQVDVVTNGQFTGLPACIQAAGQTAATRGQGDTQSISPNIKQPTVLRANIGLRTEFNFGDTGFFSGWNLNLDYIYSRYRNPFTLVDLSQTIANIPGGADIGLNGFTVDGRPIYRAVDPNNAGCDAQLVDLNPAPVFSNLSPACFNTGRDDELQLTNSAGYDSHIASVILSKSFDGGLFTEGGSSFFSAGYSYTDAQDRRNLYNSTAGSNYDLSAAFDRQNPAASRGFYSSKHNFTLSTSFAEQFFDDLDTRVGFTFVARSGRPYSLTFSGGGVFNDSASGNNNALLYVPTGADDPNISPPIFNAAGDLIGGSNPDAVRGLVDLLGTIDCDNGFEGRTISRNTCENDWYFDLDLTFSQELPGPARLFGIGDVRDSLKLYATFDNFLNFLDDEWNVQRRRNFSGLQDVASLGGIDAQGRYIISGSTDRAGYDDDNQINTSSSVWQLKVGVSYNF